MKNTISAIPIFSISILMFMLLAGCAKEIPPSKQITNFEECSAAGNPVMESYPRQCSANGNTFTEKVENPVEPPAGEAVGEDTEAAGQQIVGGDRDEHGCIGSAGYSWCEEKRKCLRVWEEPCEAEPSDEEQTEELTAGQDEETTEEPSQEQATETKEPTPEERAREIAKQQVLGMSEYTQYNGRNLVVNNVQVKSCTGCYDIEVYFERDSVANPDMILKATMHVNLERWKVKDVTADFEEAAEGESVCKDECGDGTCDEVVCMQLGCPCAETPESCPEDCA